MADWDGPDLRPLVREVDHTAARSLFDVRRRRRRHGRLLGGALVVVTLLVVFAIGWSLRSDERDRVVATGTTDHPTRDVGFDVIAQRQAVGDQMGQLRAATNAAQFAGLWADVGFADEPPAVDFEAQVVVSITIPDDACPPELVRFARDGDNQITPEFEEPQGVCIQPLIPKTYVVALDRDSVLPAFVLHLPADPTYGYPEQQLPVDLTDNLAASTTTERRVATTVAESVGAGSTTLTVELEDAPMYREGFDYAVRFRGSDGTVLATLGQEDFAKVAARSFRAVFELPVGTMTVDSHLTLGMGPGPIEPDFATESGAPLCQPMALELAADEPVDLTLDWPTGCLILRN